MMQPDCEQILQHCIHGVIGTDLDGNIIHINRKAKQILHHSGLLQQNLHISDLMPVTGQLVMDTIKNRKPYFGYQVNEKQEYLIVSISVIKDGQDVTGAVCSFVAMDEFEAVAHELDFIDFLDKRFETVFDASYDGIWICDREGKVLKINKATEKILGLHRSEVIGVRVRDLEERGLYDKTLTDEVIRTKKKISQLQTALLTNKRILCTGIPVLDKNGDVALVVINERDLSKLIETQQQLEDVTQEKDRYKAELATLLLKELRDNEIIAENERMRAIMQTATRFGQMDASDILIQGESGTGKGLVAKFIHGSGKRSSKPFIEINCAAIPESILEAELFGYEKGAFTGAKETGKPGLIELAHEGTLFLDEIGELPLAGQAKLLKYLDDHKVMRIGGTTLRQIDCVIIAATNQNLEKLVEEKKFRADLYFRLNSLPLTLPPLRKRPEDIFQLTSHFLKKANNKFGLRKKINPLIIAMMQTYSFPGNIRELKNIIHKGVIMSDSECIDRVVIECIGKEVVDEVSNSTQNDQREKSLDDIMASFEKEIVKNAVKQCHSTREIAKYLGVSQPTIVRKLKRHGLSTQ